MRAGPGQAIAWTCIFLPTGHYPASGNEQGESRSTEVEEGERNAGGGAGAGGRSEAVLAMLVEVAPQGTAEEPGCFSSPMRGFLQVQTQGSWRYGKLVPGSLVTLGSSLPSLGLALPI